MIFNYLFFALTLCYNGVIFFSFIIGIFIIRMLIKLFKLRKNLATVSDFYRKLEEK